MSGVLGLVALVALVADPVEGGFVDAGLAVARYGGGVVTLVLVGLLLGLGVRYLSRAIKRDGLPGGWR